VAALVGRQWSLDAQRQVGLFLNRPFWTRKLGADSLLCSNQQAVLTDSLTPLTYHVMLKYTGGAVSL